MTNDCICELRRLTNDVENQILEPFYCIDRANLALTLERVDKECKVLMYERFLLVYSLLRERRGNNSSYSTMICICVCCEDILWNAWDLDCRSSSSCMIF